MMKIYQEIFDSLKEGIILIDTKNNKIDLVNKRFLSLLGVSKDSDPSYILSKIKKLFNKKGLSIREKSFRGKYLCIIEDIGEKIEREEQIELLKRLYSSLSAINILITVAETKKELFEKAVFIIKEKAKLSYVRIYEKETNITKAEIGDYEKDSGFLCIDFGKGRERYVLEIGLPEGIKFEERQKELLEEIAHDLSFALSKIEKQEKLVQIAYYDQITHLPNRLYLVQKLEEILRKTDLKVALIILGIDKFSQISHTLGPYWTDYVIRNVAFRIKTCIRDSDFLARIGYDRFAIIVESEYPDDIASRMIERIRNRIKEPIYVNKTELRLSFSFGIAIYPYDAHEKEELISNAIVAFEKAKEKGDEKVFFTKELSKKIKDKISLSTELRRALERGEFSLYYQPKVDLVSGKIIGAEALIRWTKEGKVIQPYSFIPVLEESGLIYEVGKWVAEEAGRHIIEWKKMGLNIDVAINVSAVQLRDPVFIRDLISFIKKNDMRNLEIEITESAVMEDIIKSVSFLKELKDMGIKTYIDDFGTGYSSLAYLKKLPVYGIKIDLEFIKDLHKSKENEEIVKAAIAISKTYGFKTVAEGVERKEHVEILKRLGCDFVQGYYFSPPLPKDQFTELILQKQGK